MYRLELVGTEKGIEIYSYGNLFDCLPEIGVSGDGLELVARIVNTPIEFVGDCIAECINNPIDDGINAECYDQIPEYEDDEINPPADSYIDYRNADIKAQIYKETDEEDMDIPPLDYIDYIEPMDTEFRKIVK